jgi:uncharacterized protein
MSLIRQLQVPFLIILFAFLCLFVFTKLLGPIPFSVNSIQTTKSDMFTVQGEGEATAVPDTAELNMGITKQAATVQEAQNQVNDVMNTIIQDLQTLGVEKEHIKTTNYSVNPDYDFSGGRQVAKGYTVSQDIRIKVTPIEQANKALDIATSRGATNIGGITFTLNDEEKEKLQETARKDAIMQAKKKAESISRESGIKLGKLVNIYVADTPPDVMPYGRGADLSLEQKAEPVPATEISPGENTVRVSVTLSYETL